MKSSQQQYYGIFQEATQLYFCSVGPEKIYMLGFVVTKKMMILQSSLDELKNFIFYRPRFAHFNRGFTLKPLFK